MKRVITTAVILVAIMAATAMSAAAREVVAIHLRGYYFTEPASVRVTVTVVPDAENRTLRIEADGDQMFRSSEVELTGADDKRVHTIEFKNLAAGAYTLRAEVLSASGVIGMDEQELLVAGR